MLLCIGANLDSAAGRPARTLVAAVAEMARAGLELRAVSRFFTTPGFPDPTAPAYVNAAVAIACDLSPDAVLGVLHRIEGQFGRKRDRRWGARTLDLDLLAAGQTVLPDLAGFRAWADLAPCERGRVAPEQLILPHPRLQERAFVLVPLSDIAPDWRHPVWGRTVAQMCAALPRADVAAVRPL